MINEANAAFERHTRERHLKGEKEYGHNTFLPSPTIDMALEEVADMGNYIRYTYIRLYLLQKMVERSTQATDKEQMVRGDQGFIPMSELVKAFGWPT